MTLAKLLGAEVRGLYAGTIIGALCILVPREFIFGLSLGLWFVLIINIVYLGINTFIPNAFVEPIFTSGADVYKHLIIRRIEIFGQIFELRRCTGIADNIHISAFICLLFIFICDLRQWRILFLISVIILFANLNLQYLLIFIIWFFTKRKKLSSLASLLKYSILGLAIFLTIDSIFTFGYIGQIAASDLSNLVSEFSSFLSIIDINSFLFGLPIDAPDFYNPKLGYYLPITDIGLLGIPLQFGLLGVFTIILNYLFWLKYSSTKLKHFLVVSLLAIVHYFSLASAIAIVLLFIMIKLQVGEEVQISGESL